MAPPIRHSTIRKDPNKFQHSYLQNHGAQHGSQSMLIKTVTAQHMQHNKSTHGAEMSKFANGRIPFADAPNPPAAPQQQSQHKTPVRPAGTAAPTPAPTQPSPQYPPSESIVLPEINTDSEDDDSDAEKFEAPEWTRTPELRALLEQQQLVDPETVFGPIAPLHMEEVFSRGSSKERPPEARRNASASARAARRVGSRMSPRAVANGSGAAASHSVAIASRNGTPNGMLNRFSACLQSVAPAGSSRPRSDRSESIDGTTGRHAQPHVVVQRPLRCPTRGSR